MLRGRLRTGEWLAGAGGVALLVVEFLPWYGLGRLPLDATAWEAFAVTDVLIALTALLGLAVPASAALYRSPGVPVSVAVVAGGVAIVIALLVLYRLIDEPGPNAVVSLETGAYVGLLGVLAVAAGGWVAMADERTEVAEVTEVPARPAPAAGAASGVGSAFAREAAPGRGPTSPAASEPPS